MLQMFGQMMMMPISMATAGMNMMAGTMGGGRGDGRAGWDLSLERWLGGCCGSREGPRNGGAARSLDARGAGWTAQGGGSGTPRLASGYRSGADSRSSGGGYRSGTESRPSPDYRSGAESTPSVDYRSGNESRPSIETRSGNEPRSSHGSGSRSGDCGCGKRSGGGGCGCGCGSEGAKNQNQSRKHDHYREERRMSSCSCCEDRHTIVRLVEYWVVNVRHCNERPYLGSGYEAYTEDFGDCDLDTWLLGKWVSDNRDKVKPGEEKYLRIKVNRLGEWHTMDDCCEQNRQGNREVDVLRDINKTLKDYLGRQFGDGKPATAGAPA